MTVSIYVGDGNMPRSMRVSKSQRLSPNSERAWVDVRYLLANSYFGSGTVISYASLMLFVKGFRKYILGGIIRA